MNEYPEAKYDCCRHAENRLDPEPTDNPDVVIRRCGVCQRRHFEASIDPMQLGVQGNNLDAQQRE